MPPALVRKLLICAGAQGVLLQPVNQRNQPSSSPSVQIAYKTNAVSPSLRAGSDEVNACEQIEAHGIVGVLNLTSTSYLISIARREQIAQIRGKPIYVITDVTLIPLSSQADAESAISSALKAISKGKNTSTDDGDSSEEEEDHGSTIADDHEQSPVTPVDPTNPAEIQKSSSPLKKGTSVVEDVIKDKGKYGRFAKQWFSKNGWSANGRRKLGMSSEEDLTREQKRQGLESLPDDSEPTEQSSVAAGEKANETEVLKPDETEIEQPKTPASTTNSVLESLTPRIVRTTKLFFASRNFFFSYDLDISRSLSRQESDGSSVPLFKRFDPLYFWNQHLCDSLVDAGQHAFVLPLMQGFVGQRAFTISQSVGDAKSQVVDAAEKSDDVIEAQETAPKPADFTASSHSPPEGGPQLNDAKAEDFLLTLISRRSIKRAGLRYLRRGIDEDGSVANSVETEQVLSRPSWNATDRSFSFVQIRGSIPLFFSQSPYSFKPLPITYGSEATNHAAFNKHFASVLDRYGGVQAVSLVDKHGSEVNIGESYEHHAQLTNDAQGEDNGMGLAGKSIGFEWFDFHSECRGMKFENVSILLNTLKSSLSTYGWTEQQDDKLTRTQSGVLRVNCMDCLDRTNVVQSATAGHTLQAQLSQLGLTIDLQTDPKTSWFNTLWADNGDAISRQYAGTAALKGDFTRTRKRTWPGAIADFSKTLNRYYNNIFGDYFLQTCIDYYLGNAGPSVFEEFETDMMTQDYALDMGRIRQNAIETCVKVVLEDPAEDMIAGWTLSCPSQANTLRSLPFEECVMLLTDAAIYACRFDWQTEKVSSFERLDLAEIEGVQYGAYVTSTLAPPHMDEKKNVGFLVKYRPHGEVLVRTNTRSLANEKKADSIGEEEDDGTATGEKEREKAEEGIQGTDMAPSKSDATAEASKSDVRVLAFKALPPRASAAKGRSGDGHADEMSEMELVQHICGEVQRLTKRAVEKQTADDEGNGKMWEVEHKDVISVTDAKRSTGLLESIQYSLKKLVWA